MPFESKRTIPKISTELIMEKEAGSGPVPGQRRKMEPRRAGGSGRLTGAPYPACGLKDLRKDAIQPIQCPSSGSRWRCRCVSWPNRKRDLPRLVRLARRRCTIEASMSLWPTKNSLPSAQRKWWNLSVRLCCCCCWSLGSKKKTRHL